MMGDHHRSSWLTHPIVERTRQMRSRRSMLKFQSLDNLLHRMIA